MDGKNWYESKIVALGILQTIIGGLTLFADWYRQGDFSVPSAALLVAGILTVVIRIWFTQEPIRR